MASKWWDPGIGNGNLADTDLNLSMDIDWVRSGYGWLIGALFGFWKEDYVDDLK